MAKELTCTCSIIIAGEAKCFDELSSAELETVENNWIKRLSDSMSRYYSAHGEEFEKIFRKAEKRTV